MQRSCSLWRRAHVESLATHQQANDETEQTQNRTENLDDENLDKPKCEKIKGQIPSH